MAIRTQRSAFRRSRFAAQPTRLAFALALACASAGAFAQNGDSPFGGDGLLLVSRSVYDNAQGNVTPGMALPPNCNSAQASCPTGGAPYDGRYPAVWNNVLYDPSFGITSRIFLDAITPAGQVVRSLEVPNNLHPGKDHDGKGSDQLVTSFSSKSELALNLSSDGRYVTFMGYVAPVNTLDVSNSNTPGAVDPTNPDGQTFYRAVARLDAQGHFDFTETNAYSGNNGRAAVLNNHNDNGKGNGFYYTVGNAGNGANPQPAGVILGAGSQFIEPTNQPEAQQKPGTPAPLASFSVTQLGAKADKVGKDDNFRGLTVFNGVVYFTKGSGSNGVNTVYFVDTTGKACPSGGVGVPVAGAKLPTSPLAYDASTVATSGLPGNVCVLAGFPVTPNKSATTLAYPFGLWFADANTLYVADEGDGYAGGMDLYTHAAQQTTAGLQKWVYNAGTKSWKLAYTLQNGLNLGASYTVQGYPSGINSATNLPWSPATDGLRNLTGHVEQDGTVTIWAITSTVSGNGDQGADPNRLVAVRDVLRNTSATGAAQEHFVTLENAAYGEVLRGVSLAPGGLFGKWF
jgi:hypothetical protein